MEQKDKIVAELEAIRTQHKGILKPADVVAFAKDATTALHERFEWNDGTAAAEHRIWQARQVIRTVVTILPQSKKQVRVYVSLQRERAKGGGYRTVEAVLKRKALRSEMLAEALADLGVFERKYSVLTELTGVFEAARRARDAAGG